MNRHLLFGLATLAMVASRAADMPLRVELVSATRGAGTPLGTGDGASSGPILSRDGKLVAFTSAAGNLTTNDLSGGKLGGFLDVFAREVQGGAPRLISVTPAGNTGGNGDSVLTGLSRDGGRILFESIATDLVAGDRNGTRDVYVRDLASGVTLLASVNAAGNGSGNGESANASITPDGRFVVFESHASDLVPGDNNGARDVFVRDLTAGTTLLVSQATSGTGPGDGASDSPVISEDGRVVMFSSAVSSLTNADTNKLADLFIRDLPAGTTLNLTGNLRAFTTAGSESYQFALSANGRYAVFRAGDGSTRVRNADNGVIFWRDLQAATNVVVAEVNASLLPGDLEALDISADGGYVLYGLSGSIWRWNARDQMVEAVATDGLSFNPVMTPDARWLAYFGPVANGDPAAPIGDLQIFLRDLNTNIVRVVTARADGSLSGGNEIAVPSLSDDGRFVAFESADVRLAASDVNRTYDAFVRDVEAGATLLASSALPGNTSVTGDGASRFEPAAVSANGRWLLYASTVETLVANDTNGFADIFLFDRDRGSNILVSVNREGTGSANGNSSAAILSANGQVAGFFSTASNLTGDKTNNVTDFYIRDLARGVTRRIIPPEVFGARTEGIVSPVLSGDGRYLACIRLNRLFRLDLLTGIATNLLQAGASAPFTLSDDGRWIAVSASVVQQQLVDAATGTTTRLASVTPPSAVDSFRFAGGGGALLYSFVQSNSYQLVAVDLADFRSETVSLNHAGQPQQSFYKPDQSVSADGNFVAFLSADDQLTAGDTNQLRDVFVRDRRAGKTMLVSVNAAGTASGNGLSDNPSISADGRHVLFRSEATDLVAGELVTAASIFVRDLQTSVTRLVSRNYAGTGGSNLRVGPPTLSADGSTTYFASFADDLAPGDGNTQQDIFFVRLGTGATGTTDSDGDGLPDEWERQHFGALTRDGGGDFDGDGFSDRGELGAGTNPASRESALRIELIHVAGMDWSLRWPSVTGKTYRIQNQSTLNGGAWTDLPGEIAGNGAMVSVPLPAVIDAEGGYFQVVVR
jgi:Tol biopolymer transport system component